MAISAPDPAEVTPSTKSKSRPARSSSSVSTYTPPIAAGTEPTAIQVESLKSTVLRLQCL